MTQFFFPFTSIGGDRQYNARDFATYFHSIFTDGVIATVKDKLRVSQTEQVGMQVVVNTGAAFIHGHLYLLSEPIILSVTPGSSTSDRVDSIVLQLDHLERNMKILYKQGTTSVRRDENYWELQLATIDVPRNATQVWNRQINDTRADKSVGGYSKLQGELDVEGMEQHYESLLQQLTQDMATWSADKQTQFQDDWNTWFATVQGVLEGDVATNLLNMITQLQSDFSAHQADDATTSKKGHVQLSNATDSTSQTLAATPNAVKQAYDRANEAFTSASNGKQLVGNAITGVDENVVIPTEPTFEDLASAIGGISTGKKWARGTAPGDTLGIYYPRVTVTGLTFTPSILIVKQIDATEDYRRFSVYVDKSILPNSVEGINVRVSDQSPNIGIFEDEGNGVFLIRVYTGGFLWDWIAIE